MGAGGTGAGCRAAACALATAALLAAGCGRVWFEPIGAAAGADPDAAVPGAEPDAAGPAGAVALMDSGWSHVCAVFGGQAYCWGQGASGQLGAGDRLSRPEPIAVQGLPAGTIEDLSAGLDHSCAIVAGDVYCWGENSQGQLGTGGAADELVATAVTGLPAGAATEVSAARYFTCAVVAGKGLCWGNNGGGELGDGQQVSSDVPVAITGFDDAVSHIAAGGDHACGVRAGQAYCWGHNDGGALGNGTADERSLVPVAVVGLDQATAVAIAGFHGCGLDAGRAYCWGTGDLGELGDGGFASSNLPVAVAGLDDGVTALDVAGGADYGDASCAIREGRVRCWGRNEFGRLGDGTAEPRGQPVEVAGLETAAAVSGGEGHFCARLTDDAIWCWGLGTDGQLGDGAMQTRTAPVQVRAP